MDLCFEFRADPFYPFYPFSSFSYFMSVTFPILTGCREPEGSWDSLGSWMLSQDCTFLVVSFPDSASHPKSPISMVQNAPGVFVSGTVFGAAPFTSLACAPQCPGIAIKVPCCIPCIPCCIPCICATPTLPMLLMLATGLPADVQKNGMVMAQKPQVIAVLNSDVSSLNMVISQALTTSEPNPGAPGPSDSYCLSLLRLYHDLTMAAMGGHLWVCPMVSNSWMLYFMENPSIHG